MLDLRVSPPPLLTSTSISDQESSSSRDATPETPVAADKPSPGKQSVLPLFQRQPYAPKPTTSLCLESSLTDLSFDDTSFPLFGAPSSDQSMATFAPPNDNNVTIRQTSTSPRGNQPSGLTAAFKQEQSNDSGRLAVPNMEGFRPIAMPSEPSDMSRFENGARPISVKGRPMDKNRRESLAQSLGMGMSWGGASVGSFIRDE